VESKAKNKSKIGKKRGIMSIPHGIQLNGRILNIALAVDRAEAQKRFTEKKMQREDKRNLWLTREGLILPEDEAAKELNKADIEKRLRAYKEKKAKLKNPNYVVSKVRLSVRNIPTEVDEKQLKKVFLTAANKNNPLSHHFAPLLWHVGKGAVDPLFPGAEPYFFQVASRWFLLTRIRVVRSKRPNLLSW